MANETKKGALIAGIILIALGVILFLEIWSVSFSIWHFIGRYWPVILIIVGIRKLYNYFSWQEAAVAPVIDSTAKE
jgi:uncharacterized membrane protein HdeD (DUF308 family)